jgi:hypothetical protein
MKNNNENDRHRPWAINIGTIVGVMTHVLREGRRMALLRYANRWISSCRLA